MYKSWYILILIFYIIPLNTKAQNFSKPNRVSIEAPIDSSEYYDTVNPISDNIHFIMHVGLGFGGHLIFPNLDSIQLGSGIFFVNFPLQLEVFPLRNFGLGVNLASIHFTEDSEKAGRNTSFTDYYFRGRGIYYELKGIYRFISDEELLGEWNEVYASYGRLEINAAGLDFRDANRRLDINGYTVCLGTKIQILNYSNWGWFVDVQSRWMSFNEVKYGDNASPLLDRDGGGVNIRTLGIEASVGISAALF